MPHSPALARLEDSATKRPSGDTPCPSSQLRAVRALVIVSMVVKVLEAMTNSVGCAGQDFSTSAMSAPSTLETKCVRGPS